MTNEVRLTSVFSRWLDDLKDRKAASLIVARIDRLAYGLAGDVKRLGDVSELRIDHGPGYRLYFCRRGGALYVLLCGGTKRTQERDIDRARKMAKEIGHDH